MLEHYITSGKEKLFAAKYSASKNISNDVN